MRHKLVNEWLRGGDRPCGVATNETRERGHRFIGGELAPVLVRNDTRFAATPEQSAHRLVVAVEAARAAT